MAGWNEPPKSTSTNTPLSEVGVSGDATPAKLQGGPSTVDANGNKIAPVMFYANDGNDVNQGATTDAAVVGDAPGTIASKIRGLSRMINNVWDSANGRLKVDGSAVTQPVALVSGTKATYTYAISATAPGYATPQDWIVIRGSATKTVKIIRFEASGVATAATTVVFTLKKHTIANTAGTSTNPAFMKHDSNDAAATALVLLYTVLPTIDASATVWKTVRLNLNILPAASTAIPDRYVYDYAAEPYEPLVLRGVAQEFAINFAAAAIPGGAVYDIAITVTEE